ncbi:LIM domain-binding protein 2-like isoform X3 [Dreissena polymorpha]|uniref:LIM domain-binding protein 2-like isoform X3 n=1 Tax=Dreissena polymorpha TaxID=45954 RepID=UPI002263AE4A|nr:LIM domain-binding protein 2-like isoform X3 [Dreissena polymorpha]
MMNSGMVSMSHAHGMSMGSGGMPPGMMSGSGMPNSMSPCMPNTMGHGMHNSMGSPGMPPSNMGHMPGNMPPQMSGMGPGPGGPMHPRMSPGMSGPGMSPGMSPGMPHGVSPGMGPGPGQGMGMGGPQGVPGPPNGPPMSHGMGPGGPMMNSDPFYSSPFSMYSNRRQAPYMGQPDYRMYELNKRLQQRSEDSDNLWWDAFATEFFEDEASLTLSFCLEDGPKRYTIGRTLIPRYFRSIFEGGVTDLYYILKHPKESFHNTSITLDCDVATMVTHHGKPMFTKVVTEGRLVLEFTFDDLMRIRSWHFATRQHRELIPRNIIAMQMGANEEPAMVEQLGKNITRQGLTNYTLNFLRLCVILEPMQELMSRHKAYGLTPRDCLKTTLFQKWQRMVSPPGKGNPQHGEMPNMHPQDMPGQKTKNTTRQPGKRRKRKSSTGSAANVNSAVPPSGKQKRSPGPQGINSSVPGDVMVVGEPTLMGGEFGDEDERLITRLENQQYENSLNDEEKFNPNSPALQQHNSPWGGGGDKKPMIPTSGSNSMNDDAKTEQ